MVPLDTRSSVFRNLIFRVIFGTVKFIRTAKFIPGTSNFILGTSNFVLDRTIQNKRRGGTINIGSGGNIGRGSEGRVRRRGGGRGRRSGRRKGRGFGGRVVTRGELLDFAQDVRARNIEISRVRLFE